MTHKVDWIDGKREPQDKPDPRFPRGMDIDVSRGASRTCTVKLPYPARRCGVYVIECDECGQLNVATTAGRPDDPRSLKIACKGH